MSNFSSLAARDAEAAQAQDAINSLSLVGEIRSAILARIQADLGQCPQYAGHGEGPEWSLGFVRHTVRTKRGIAFRRGDVVLFRERSEVERRFGGLDCPTAYSVRNGIDTAIGEDAGLVSLAG